METWMAQTAAQQKAALVIDPKATAQSQDTVVESPSHFGKPWI